MSDDKDDLELEALQRELDDAFATTRPRRGFEDELWARMQARRPFGARLRDVFASIAAGFRAAPAVPIGAVAVLLIVVIGAGVLLNSGLRRPPEATSGGTALSQSAPDLATAVFGKLPTPALHPGQVDRSVQAGGSYAVQPAPAPPSNLYFGPANLTWTGTFPTAPFEAPVYRYVEPAPDQLRAFPVASAPGVVAVAGTEPNLPREPIYVVTASGGDVPPGSDPTDIANTYLGQHNLTPQWPNLVTVQTAGGTSVVRYARGFAANGDIAYFVDWNGERAGLDVDIASGHLVVTGPLPVSLAESSYRLISNERAAQLALASAPASVQAIQPAPNVNLSTVELVYALAFANGQGFYEPAYLFSGTFSYNGQTYTKRVLVPLVDPSLRS